MIKRPKNNLLLLAIKYKLFLVIIITIKIYQIYILSYDFFKANHSSYLL